MVLRREEAQRRGRNKSTSEDGQRQGDTKLGALSMEEYTLEIVLLESPLEKELYA